MHPFVLVLSFLAGLHQSALARAAREQAPVVEGRASVWQERASADVVHAEYSFQPVAGEDGVWSAPNRAQELRSRVARGGLDVFPRATSASAEGAPWRVRLRTVSFGRTDGSLELVDRVPSVQADRAEFDHVYLVEWIENRREGIEHGWTIGARPLGAEPLWIGLSFEGDLELRIEEGLRSAVLVDPCGRTVLRYRDLAAFDATGRALAARLCSRPTGVGIEIDDGEALYPLTVDPLLTGPTWTVEGDQAGANLGISVAAAGDVNGDGYSDVILGADLFDSGQADEGRAYLYLGSSAGLALGPAWTGDGNQTGASFGHSVATAGDVNGDGYSDVIVGASGRAQVFLGSATGLAATPAWTRQGGQAGDAFGYSVATAGDVNGDGYSDVIVGAALFDGGETDEGRAHVYLGSSSGLSTSAAWTAESDQAGAFLGWSVSTAGDVNGDGYGDVIVGAYGFDDGQVDEGRAYLYLGSASGLAASPAWTAESDQAGAWFGNSVANAGDVNGDGYGDVIVGADRFDNGQTNEGRAFLYLGSSSGLSAGSAWTAESDQAEARYGRSVATAGDVNGDGCSDVVIGAPDFTAGQVGEGRAFLYVGSPTGLSIEPAWTAENDQGGAQLGISASTAGDVNGDGYGDVIVGASSFSGGQVAEGRATLYLGAAFRLAAAPAWTAEGDQSFSDFGGSCATAGDVNGDGYDDVIVGARSFDAGQTNEGRAFLYLGSTSGLASTPAWTAESDQAGARLGGSLSTAGDVNGDGYDDVILGAHSFDAGQVDEGIALLYLGTAAGLEATPAWTAEGDQASAFFGCAVASAGDVNGDGYADVIVGAYGAEGGESFEGRAYVYLGSSAGLASAPAWTAESDVAFAWFGASVATAGDVNDDGHADVIVGAPRFEDGQSAEGRAYVYLGSSAGLATIPAWTVESDQTNAQLGASVASAGDVNGDGYADVVVGAPNFAAGQANEGRAQVHLGSSTGLAASPAWTAESDLASAGFGTSVATAGDVNGDGYGDVIVGASGFSSPQQQEGSAWIYLGSATGLATSPSWRAEGDGLGASLGSAVATAGDVDGDGRSEVLVGAKGFGNDQASEGRALVYGILDPGGWLTALQQRRRDGSAPLPPLGDTGPSGLFRIRGDFPRNLAAFSWASPAAPRAHLEWEIEPLRRAFDGLGIERGDLEEVLLPSVGTVTFDELAAAGLGPPKVRDAKTPTFHWRARVATNNPLFPHTPWFTSSDFALRKTERTP